MRGSVTMVFMKGDLTRLIVSALEAQGAKGAKISLEYTENPEHGDFSTSAALAYAGELKIAPKALAEKIAESLKDSAPEWIEGIEIAGPGFINFRIKAAAIAESVIQISGAGSLRPGPAGALKKVIVEYTDPNTFKVFHIGHIMSNAIGESFSRLIEFAGSKVIRICYPSDVGLHIAKSVWAIRKHLDEMPSEGAAIIEKTAFLGKMYVEGTNIYEEDARAKSEIDALNQAIYEKTDPEAVRIAETGRRLSLEHFDLLYKTLGTSFDESIYESEMAPIGLKIVKAHIGKVFEESEGAIVFKGEDHGLHTRVFVSSKGLPTYEAKEIGLNITKFEHHPDTDLSIIVTANEQKDYFRVLAKVMAEIDPKNGPKLLYKGHGVMRFASGKMSSRKGNVITADALIGELKGMVLEKMKERGYPEAEAAEIAEQIAVAAIKYTVLRSSVGSDIIFDSVASISFEGDSGPYLQYSAVRANSVLEKAKGAQALPSSVMMPQEAGLLERLLIRFPDVAARAAQEFSPQQVAGYLISLAGAFNGFYAGTQILEEKDPMTPYRVALTRAFYKTMSEGLWLLGIKVPQRM